MRIGHGYDVHRLVEDRLLILGGITIPFKKGLLGHSDADVLLHSIIDAILGALAMGDIGTHFPDSDPQYEGISSAKLLLKVRDMMVTAGYEVENIDVTVVLQLPKLGPYILQIRSQIAEMMQIDSSRINVKATTEEGLGFTGTGQGIACHCVCLLKESSK